MDWIVNLHISTPCPSWYGLMYVSDCSCAHWILKVAVWPCTLQHYNTIYYTLNIPFFLFILVNLYEIQHSSKIGKAKFTYTTMLFSMKSFLIGNLPKIQQITHMSTQSYMLLRFRFKIQISFVCWLIIYIYWCLITYIQICVFWNILLCVCWCRLAIFNSSNGMHILDLSLCKNPIWQKRKKTNISISTCCGVK